MVKQHLTEQLTQLAVKTLETRWHNKTNNDPIPETKGNIT